MKNVRLFNIFFLIFAVVCILMVAYSVTNGEFVTILIGLAGIIYSIFMLGFSRKILKNIDKDSHEK